MLNELSVCRVDSASTAYKLLETFVKSYIRAKQLGFLEMRLYENSIPNLYSISLHENTNIGSWLNDKRVNSDLRDRFKEIVTTTPLIKDAEFEHNELYARSEFFKELDGKSNRVWGLGAAHIYDTIAVSFDSHEEWKKENVVINHRYLNESGDLLEKESIVKNFSSSQNIAAHLDWLEELRKKNLEQSADIWNNRKEFFPNLELGEGIERQLKLIGISKHLFQIIDRLKSLNDYAEFWKKGDFNYLDVNQKTNLRISPESEITLKMYGTQRKFFTSGQKKEVFSLHIKTGDLRFHFFPDNNEHKIYVGYIGKHLRTHSES